jgi:hypothetical protein
MKRLIYTAILMCLSLLPVLAQQAEQGPCGVPAIFKNAAFKEFMPGGRHFESWLARKQKEETENKSIADNDEIYTIPVVVHVLHNGEAVGTDRNLSDTRVLSQINILNNDFGRLPNTPGFNTHPAGADTRIRFCLASADPQGQPTNGINRVNTNQDGFNFLTDNTLLKSFGTWDTDKYLNIWVCKILGNQYIGYAQYPYIPSNLSDSLPMVGVTDVLPDGVVADYRVFGDVPAGQSGPFPSYNKGRTITHEIGHYLGLIHIWADASVCSDPANTDFCEDTPKQETFTSGCPTGVLASCTTGVPRMKENYMDYTNDACMNIFTSDQKRRMRMVLRNCIRRKSLLTSPVIPCSANTDTQPPVFPANKKIKCYYRDNNEFSNILVVEAPDKATLSEVVLFDFAGRAIPFRSLDDESKSPIKSEIQLTGLACGIYFIRITTSDGQKYTTRFARRG